MPARCSMMTVRSGSSSTNLGEFVGRETLGGAADTDGHAQTGRRRARWPAGRFPASGGSCGCAGSRRRRRADPPGCRARPGRPRPRGRPRPAVPGNAADTPARRSCLKLPWTAPARFWPRRSAPSEPAASPPARSGRGRCGRVCQRFAFKKTPAEWYQEDTLSQPDEIAITARPIPTTASVHPNAGNHHPNHPLQHIGVLIARLARGGVNVFACFSAHFSEFHVHLSELYVHLAKLFVHLGAQLGKLGVHIRATARQTWCPYQRATRQTWCPCLRAARQTAWRCRF